MVCEILCLPAITLLIVISEKLGLSEGVTGIFIGALTIGIAEIENKLINKLAKKFDKKEFIPFQLTIIILVNLIIVAWLFNTIRI